MQAADAYAFGILLWELYTCSRAWADLTHVQVLPSSAVCMHIDQKLHAPGCGCVSVLVRDNSLHRDSQGIVQMGGLPVCNALSSATASAGVTHCWSSVGGL